MFGFDDMALATVGSSIIGGGLSMFGASSANAANKAMAREQMAFQERMRNTAHQAEVKDLRAAGLNPILSANSGAPMAMGAMPVMHNIFQDAPGLVGGTAKSLLDYQAAKTQRSIQALNSAEIAKLKADTRRLNLDADISQIEKAVYANQTSSAASRGWLGKYIVGPLKELLGAWKGQRIH